MLFEATPFVAYTRSTVWSHEKENIFDLSLQ